MIIFDTETNGLIDNLAIPLKRQPQIIELFALKLDDALIRQLAQGHAKADTPEQFDAWMEEMEVGTWHSLFSAKVSEEITQITSIDAELLKGAPKFAERVDSLAEFHLGQRILGGHNLAFDRDMLMLELKRLDMVCRFPWPMRHICSVEATEDVEGYRLSLENLHEQLFGHKFEGAHRAENDVRATARCFVKLICQGRITL